MTNTFYIFLFNCSDLLYTYMCLHICHQGYKVYTDNTEGCNMKLCKNKQTNNNNKKLNPFFFVRIAHPQQPQTLQLWLFEWIMSCLQNKLHEIIETILFSLQTKYCKSIVGYSLQQRVSLSEKFPYRTLWDSKNISKCVFIGFIGKY